MNEEIEEKFSLPEGQVLMRLPKSLDKESVQFLEEWFELLIRKWKRRAMEREQKPELPQ